MARFLIVDDEQPMRFTLRELLRRDGHHVDEAAGGQEAVCRHKAEPYDVVIMDYKMPGLSGIEALRELIQHDPHAVVIMVTALADRQIGVDAVQHGAFDFFCKPFDVDELRVVIRRGLERRRLMEAVTTLAAELNRTPAGAEIIGASAGMRRVFSMIDRVAGADVTVLILGESGTGKELVARSLHWKSPRAQGPFVAVNCAAIPETLLESELFGYERGAFTGAQERRKGRFEQAQGGTLFLDEIGDMDMQMQVKILRALEEREITRVGGGETIRTDIRVIAATNVDLQQAVRTGKFREDLYYRLNVVSIAIPPLRERLEDLPALVEHFVAVGNEQFGKAVRGVSDDAMRMLAAYDWPGNVRELENVIQRAMVLAEGAFLTRNDLPPELVRAAERGRAPVDAVATLADKTSQARAEIEREEIVRALESSRWRRGQAAMMLGINRRSLLRKMKRYGLS